jgi:hypothetical protein
MRETKAVMLSRFISEQRRWIEEHGDSLSGYIARYGRASDDPEKPVNEGGRYGLGGPAIYEADMSVLRDLEEQLKAVTSRRRATASR